MASSYDRISEDFARSRLWAEFTEEFREKIQKVNLTKYKMSVVTDYYDDKGYKVEPAFVIEFDGSSRTEVEETIKKDYEFPMTLVSEDRLKEISKRLFGTSGYPTYNCRLDKLNGEGKKAHDVGKWILFARNRLKTENKDLLDAFAQRIKAQYEEMIVSEHFINDKRRAYELAVINDIKKVVLKFYDKVGPEVMKEALDAVVAHAIMES